MMLAGTLSRVYTNTLGIAFQDINDSRTIMPTAQFYAWGELKSYLIGLYGNMNIYGHREKGSSECPGANFPLENVKNATINTSKGYIVTNYLKGAYDGYDGSRYKLCIVIF